MKFIISKSEFLNALAIAGKCVNINNIVSGYSMYRLSLAKNELSISAFDGERYISYLVTVESNDSGEAFIQASEIKNIIIALPDQPLTCSTDDTHFLIKANSGKYKLPFEKTAFTEPVFTHDSTIEIPGEKLSEAITKVSFCCAPNTEPRVYFQGVLFEINDDVLQVTACDTNRFATTPIVIEYSGKKEFILPKKSADIMADLPVDEVVNISVSESKVLYKPNERTVFITGVLAEKYTNYHVLFQKEYPSTAVVNRIELLSAIKRCSLFAFQYVVLKMGAKIEVIAENLDFAKDASEVVKSDYKGEEIQMAFIPSWIIPVLSAMKSETVSFKLKSEFLPPIIQEDVSFGNGNCMMVMPVKI